jgi:hypothetical protein
VFVRIRGRFHVNITAAIVIRRRPGGGPGTELRALAALVDNQEPESAPGDAGGGGRLGTLTHCRESVGKLSYWAATVDAPKAAIHGPRRPN